MIGSIDPQLDHLVYAVPDLAAAVDEMARALGVRPVPGGQHVGRGTRNELLGLDVEGAPGRTSYLELIGPDPDQPEPDRPRPFGIDAIVAPRLVTWAVHPDDLDAAVARARAAGVDPGDAEPMARRTPSGELLAWRLTTAPATPHGGQLPFLIHWGDAVHPAAGLPAVRLVSFSATTPDVAGLRAGLAALGAVLAVDAGDAERLTARLEGPGGVLELT